MSNQQTWESYEEVARYLLNHFRQQFGLECVEPKQSVAGVSSGTSWEIDAIGVLNGDSSAIILVECRQYRSKRLKQEALGALAWRIIDTGAAGGIIVSPLPLQDGAKKVAGAKNIVHVHLGPDSTPENFAIGFFNKIFANKTEALVISERTIAVLTDKDGNNKSL